MIVSGACTSHAQTARTRHTFGCMLADDEAEQFLSTSTGQQAFATGNEPIIASSGDREFDYALAQTLSRLTDTFRVLPGFAYYDDFEQPNALASSVVRMANADGTVLFGRRFLKKLLASPEHPDVAVAAVCAHEFGHILQYKLNLRPIILAGQSTTKRLELHADYLAGYYAGSLKLKKQPIRRQYLPLSNIHPAIGALTVPSTTGPPMSVRLQSFAASRLLIASDAISRTLFRSASITSRCFNRSACVGVAAAGAHVRAATSSDQC